MSPRVLLTTVPRPLGPAWGDAPTVGYDAVSGQFTRGQGILSPRAFEHHYGLSWIAANLDAPTVTLQFPTEPELVRELRAGGYTHVGIGFNVSTAHHMRRVCRLVRTWAPRAVIVLGGFGAALPEDELLRHGDVVCRGEGASFLRALLGEPALEGPGRHPLVVSTTRLLGLPLSRSGMVFGGLGCPAGCDFCCTSHQFGRRYVPLLPTGADLFRVVEGYRRLDPSGIQLRVLDEDFLSHRARALDFRDRVLEAGFTPSLFVFSSVRTLSRYTLEELVEIGVGGVFIGFEGTHAPFAKRQGRPLADLFADLRRHGIWVQASMMLGQDYQDEATVRRELEDLLALEPSAPLFSLQVPLPGTPLHDRIESENRWLPAYRDDREARWRFSDAFSVIHRHPHMSPKTLLSLQRWCYDEDFRRLGPTVLRMGLAWHEGWLHLRDRREPALRRRADQLAQGLRRLYVILPLLRTLAPSDAVRQRVEDLDHALRVLVPGPQRVLSRVASLATFPLALQYRAALGLGQHQEPRTLRQVWWGAERPATV